MMSKRRAIAQVASLGEGTCALVKVPGSASLRATNRRTRQEPNVSYAVGDCGRLFSAPATLVPTPLILLPRHLKHSRDALFANKSIARVIQVSPQGEVRQRGKG